MLLELQDKQSMVLSGGYEDDEDHREWFLYRGKTSCGHNLRLKCFQKWIGLGKDTRVECRSQISRQND
ncbi:hypothetical protein EJD97_022555 [Solanum chilense]|uniref:Uncharacterized protein n=1 Tax=Solanum chilense TaxID=4083 RepID=A0A6N2CBH3_SOLCI|nr:hypothetical protein EJD97_022555 [Solanum chilense]